jgi:PIN domain nuclease of toxin-antitoxin system
LPDAKTWLERVLAAPGIREAALTAAIAVDSSFLPGDFHGDSGDRLIVATARHLNVPVVTRDRRMLAYAETGEAKGILC